MKTYYKHKLLFDTAETYNDLTAKPSINSIELKGNKSSNDLNMYSIDQIDSLIANKRAVKVNTVLPLETVPNTIYYIGPNSEGNYHRWLYDQDNNPYDLGISGPISNGIATKVHTDAEGNNSVNVLFDDKTIKLTDDNKLKAVPEPLLDGIATHIFYDSEDNEQVDVLFDDITITLNSEGKLTATALKDGVATEVEKDSEGFSHINVLYNENTIILDSEGKLDVNIDNETVFLNSEGKIASKGGEPDEVTIVYNSEGLYATNIDYDTIYINSEGTLSAKGESIEKLTWDEYEALTPEEKMDHSIRLIVDSEGKVPGGGHEPDGVTIKLNGSDKLEAQTMVGATSTADGKRGIVPAPVAGDEEKFLSGDGTWKTAGGHLYMHTFYIHGTDSGNNSYFTTYVFTDSETSPSTISELTKWLKDNGYTSSDGLYPASGGTNSTGGDSSVLGIWTSPADGLMRTVSLTSGGTRILNSSTIYTKTIQLI